MVEADGPELAKVEGGVEGGVNGKVNREVKVEGVLADAFTFEVFGRSQGTSQFWCMHRTSLYICLPCSKVGRAGHCLLELTLLLY